MSSTPGADPALYGQLEAQVRVAVGLGLGLLRVREARPVMEAAVAAS